MALLETRTDMDVCMSVCMNGKQQHKITDYKTQAYGKEITEKWT